MSSYAPPIADMRFTMHELAGLDAVAALPGLESATADTVDAVLEEAGKFASNVLAPLDRIGDREGSQLRNGAVTTPQGWREAYRAFIEAGWNGLVFDPEWGGQGLPWLVNAAAQEMWHASNMAFSLCPMLTQGAVEAILFHGSDEQKRLYLPRLVTGEWTGTMCLTEPQAGSDLSAVSTRAVPDGDGYRITGQKIYITYGEHDLTPNIVHLVLARTPDAPEGVKGISLFLVPKFLPDTDGVPGRRNEVRCVSLEHKLGIHASPTAVLAFGDDDGAIGFRIGEENRGLEYMFTMMNVARLSVGLEGIGVADRAYQRALAYARERQQGRVAGERMHERAAIIRHPDVRRMLIDMKSRISAMRAVAYVCAASIDRAHHHDDPAERSLALRQAELLTPVVKGWSTEWAVGIASTALQVHGGMGFVEETGAAQHYRDARIMTIYEGTTGIQASDLVGRKVLRDKGADIFAHIATMRDLDALLAKEAGPAFAVIRAALREGIDALERAVAWLLAASDLRLQLAGAGPFLELTGTVLGGYEMARGALRARQLLSGTEVADVALVGRIETARYYAAAILPKAAAWARIVIDGGQAVADITDGVFQA